MYGIPCKGSKQKIADAIIDMLPSGERFVDLFGGGFAMSEAALASGKYNKVAYNDFDQRIVDVVKTALQGGYSYNIYKPEFITKEEFKELAPTDGMVATLYSFANDRHSYLYSDKMAHKKQLVYEYVLFDKYDPELDMILPESLRHGLEGETIHDRRLSFGRGMRKAKRRLDIEPLERLERIDHLKNVENQERLEFYCEDYRRFELRPGDIIYCDIPYEDGHGKQSDTYGMMKFMQDEFYDWVLNNKHQVYFSSCEINENYCDKFFCNIVLDKVSKVDTVMINKQLERLYSNRTI